MASSDNKRDCDNKQTNFYRASLVGCLLVMKLRFQYNTTTTNTTNNPLQEKLLFPDIQASDKFEFSNEMDMLIKLVRDLLTLFESWNFKCFSVHTPCVSDSLFHQRRI